MAFVFKTFGLRQKIGFSFALVGLIFLMLILRYHVTLRQALNSYQELQKVFDVKKSLSMNIDRNLKAARRNEKNFFIYRELTYSKRVSISVENIMEKAALLVRVDSNGANNAGQIIALINTYQQRFNAIVDAWIHRGLNHNTGLQGRFRDRAHELENLAERFNAERLLLRFFHIRTLENNLILQWDRQSLDQIITRIVALRQNVTTSKLFDALKAKLNRDIDDYHQAFKTLRLDGQDGHDTFVRTSKNALIPAALRIESLLTENFVPDMGQAILQLRRREKDYLLRGDGKYVDWTLRELGTIRDHILASALSREDKARLLGLSESYEKEFLGLVSQNALIAQLSTKMQTAAREVRALVEANVATAERVFKQENQATYATTQASAQLMLWMVLATILLAIFLVLAITQKISKPFQQIKHVLNRLSSGDMSARIQGELGLDEMGRISAAINSMADSVGEMIAAIRDTNEKMAILSRAVDQSPVAIMITDVQGTIEYVNPKFTQVTGYSLEESMGKNPRILKSGNVFLEVYRQLWKTLLAGDVWKGELENRKKNGALYWASTSIAPVRNSDGTVTHFVAAKEDITDQKRIARELILAKDAALASDRAKTEFLSIMSHELRTPLNAVLGFAEILSLGDLNPEQREAVDNILHSSHSLLKVFDDILILSQVESDGVRIETVPFELSSLIDGVTDAVQRGARQKSLEVKSTLSPSVPQVLVGDVKRLRLILLNLLGNAVKFTQQGRVEIAVEHEIRDGQERVHFAVSDTGIGITLEKQAFIFQPFTQVDSSYTRKYGGTGLGLTVCKRLVALMKGDLRVDSTLGQGSVFHVVLPLSRGRMPATSEALVPVPQAKRDGLKARILVVEDDSINQVVIVRILKRLAYSVELAENGQKALDQLVDKPFDLILMDCMMPVMDGFAATRELRRREQEKGDGFRIPIIALTALSRDDAWKKCMDAGMDDYFAKPVNTKKMESLLEHWLVGREDSRDGGAKEPIADRFILEALRQEMGEELDQVVSLFLDGLQRRLPAIRKACASNNMRELSSEMYALKGASLQLGLKKLADLSTEILLSIQSGKSKKVTRLFSVLEQEAKRVAAFLREEVETDGLSGEMAAIYPVSGQAVRDGMQKQASDIDERGPVGLPSNTEKQ